MNKKYIFICCTAAFLFMLTLPSNAQWQRVFGIAGGNISCLAADSGSNVYAATFQSGVLLSTDNGDNWTEINNGLEEDSFILSFAIKDSIVFAGTSGHGVFLSANNGGKWTAANNGLGNRGVVSLVIRDSNIFAGTLSDGIYLSVNNGANWIAVNNGLTNKFISSLAISGTNIFAGTYQGGVYRSSDNGSHWVAVKNGLTDTTVYSLTASGSDIFAGTLKGGIFKSSNNGNNWSAIDSSMLPTTVIALAAGESNIFAGTSTKGTYLSPDNGVSWLPFDTGLTYPYGICAYTSLAISGSYVFAGTQSTENGIWRRPLSDINAVNNISHDHVISIYPDPAGSELSIKNKGLRIKEVEIYNILGERAVLPANFQKNGEDMMIDVSELSPGIYFIEVFDQSFGVIVSKFVKD